MHKEEVELFLERAENFLDSAKQRFQKLDWDLTCFLAEQSLQLYLKATILEIGGEFPKSHSVRKLISLLYKLTENKDFTRFNRQTLLFLENAYLNSRYFNFKYEKEDAELAINFVEEVKKVVENVRFNDNK